MTSLPLISVIIPVYNGAAFLPDALATLYAQAYPSLEIIIIDDGSTDNTAEVAARHDAVYAYQPNRGPSAARNHGIRLARADYLTFLDVDDLLPPNKLRDQMARMLADSALDVISGLTLSKLMPTADDQNLFQEEKIEVGVNIGAALYRRRAFDIVGLFDETMRHSEDLDWFFRAAASEIKLVYMNRVTLYYRQHHANVTRGVTKAQQNLNLLRATRNAHKVRLKHDGGTAVVRELRSFLEAEPSTPHDEPAI